MRMIDEDDVGLKEKPEDNLSSQQLDQKDYILEIRPEAQEVRAKDWIPNFAIIRNCSLGNGQGRHSLEGPGMGWNPYPGAPPTTGLLTVGRPQSKDSCFVWGSFITDHPPGPTKSHLWQAGSIVAQILHGYPFTSPPSRSRVYFCPFLEPMRMEMGIFPGYGLFNNTLSSKDVGLVWFVGVKVSLSQ